MNMPLERWDWTGCWGERALGAVARVVVELGVKEALWENTNASRSWVLLVCHPRLPSWNTLQSKDFGVDYFQPSAFSLSCTKRKSWLGKLCGVHISQNHQYPSSRRIRPLISPPETLQSCFQYLSVTLFRIHDGKDPEIYDSFKPT